MTTNPEPIQQVRELWETDPYWSAIYDWEWKQKFRGQPPADPRGQHVFPIADLMGQIAELETELTAALAENESMKAEHAMLATMMDDARLEIERLRATVREYRRVVDTDTAYEIWAALDGDGSRP